MVSPSEGLINHVDVNDEAKDDDYFGYAMQLASSLVLPMSLYSAIELGIFEIIAKAGPDAKLSASDIAAKLSAKNPDAPMMLDRILRLLASHHVLDCSVDGLQRFYSLAPVAKYYVPNQDGVCLGPLLILGLDKVFLQCWPHLKDAILEGGLPFERAYGVHTFDYPDSDSRFNEILNIAMYNHSTIVVNHMLETYKGFENLKQLVDVGGGVGQAIKAITSKYPKIKGINYDLPHVIEHAPPYPGVEHVGGDMFESIPKGDAIFMKWVLHDWSDDHCLKLLKNCYKALPDDGKVIAMDGVLPIMPNTSPNGKYISQIDMFMLATTLGGKERTEHEFTALATAAGFRGIKYECFVLNFWVMEFFK